MPQHRSLQQRCAQVQKITDPTSVKNRCQRDVDSLQKKVFVSNLETATEYYVLINNPNLERPIVITTEGYSSVARPAMELLNAGLQEHSLSLRTADVVCSSSSHLPLGDPSVKLALRALLKAKNPKFLDTMAANVVAVPQVQQQNQGRLQISVHDASMDDEIKEFWEAQEQQHNRIIGKVEVNMGQLYRLVLLRYVDFHQVSSAEWRDIAIMMGIAKSNASRLKSLYKEKLLPFVEHKYAHDPRYSPAHPWSPGSIVTLHTDNGEPICNVHLFGDKPKTAFHLHAIGPGMAVIIIHPKNFTTHREEALAKQQTAWASDGNEVVAGETTVFDAARSNGTLMLVPHRVLKYFNGRPQTSRLAGWLSKSATSLLTWRDGDAVLLRQGVHPHVAVWVHASLLHRRRGQTGALPDDLGNALDLAGLCDVPNDNRGRLCSARNASPPTHCPSNPGCLTAAAVTCEQEHDASMDIATLGDCEDFVDAEEFIEADRHGSYDVAEMTIDGDEVPLRCSPTGEGCSAVHAIDLADNVSASACQNEDVIGQPLKRARRPPRYMLQHYR